MNENQKKIIGQVLMQFSSEKVIKEEDLRKYVNVFAMINPISDDEKEEVIKELHTRLFVRIDRGACVKEKNHKPWYNNAKANIQPAFWERYQIYLRQEQGWNNDLLNELDKATDEIMDLLGDPKQAEGFNRRGLCIGDVQSGKTSTYIGLINKAADAGYRVIILLTGTIEKLRRQTQKRVDEGFIGLDSTTMAKDNQSNAFVGVGCINSAISGLAVTTTESDFNKASAKKLVGKLAGIQAPVIFVLKKNKSVLTKLEQWLRVYNTSEAGKTIELPMLLIDDEADNASVNTKESDTPTAINEAIRKLLKLFDKANYVGFTATPYANIFIDPDSETEMLEQDLFPRHFIYALEAPNNYIGAVDLFSENGKYAYMLKNNDDCENVLPLRHKNYTPVPCLPQSLKEAIASFFIINTIRDLLGHEKTHRTMMINISRFVSVHDSAERAVDGFVRDMQREIRNYCLMGNAALEYDSFKLLHDVFIKHFTHVPDMKFTWEQVQKKLNHAGAPIEVRTVNGGNAPKQLNYEEYENGLRLIAIGGISLSRGLTLEGLCVSYFYRNSKMYDTLMQMGRWFGYRDNYKQFCQVWMPDASITWYSYISQATEELRREIRRMQDDNRTPEDFGLCVRSDLPALMVTARNKMRTAQDFSMVLDLSGHMVETPYIHSDVKKLQDNYNATETFVNTLCKKYKLHLNDEMLALPAPQFLNVDKSEIIRFLERYTSHSLNANFHTDDIIGLIQKDQKHTLDRWDVIIAGGEGQPVTFCGMVIKPATRNFSIKEKAKALQMSGKNSRLGSRTVAKGGLRKEYADEIERKALGKLPSQDTYFKVDDAGITRNPLLAIYLVQLSRPEPSDPAVKEKQKMVQTVPQPVIGLSIGFPKITAETVQKITYKGNIIKMRELLDAGEDEDGREVDETVVEEA